MRRLILLVIALISLGGVGLWATSTSQQIKREPLQKAQTLLRSPEVYAKRRHGEPGKEVTYDPRPKVEVVDAKAGKYHLKWIGYDGKQKVIEYQHPGAIDIVVTGAVEKASDGNYTYDYTVDILPTSFAYLYSFQLQNYSDDTRPVEINSRPTTLADLRILKNFRQIADDGKAKNFENTVLIGEMSRAIPQFKEGQWIAFGVLPDFQSSVVPGSRLRLKLVSKAPPGLVGCSAAAGPRTLQGVGEHMPTELEEVMPGFEAWPSGYTVGPVGSLQSLSESQRASYILDRMVEFEKLGWITPSARRWYEKTLRNDITSAVQRTHKDFASGQISSEVLAMIQAVKP